MRTRTLTILLVIVAVGVAVAVPAAATDSTELSTTSERPAIEFRDDGTIAVDGASYDGVLDWQLSDRFRSEGRRCSTKLPDVLPTRDPADCSLSSTTIDPQYDPGEVYEIPVVFHVISRTDGTGNLADSYLTSQLAILNEDFRAAAGTLGGGGYDTGIQFVLATEDPGGNPTGGIERVTSNTYFTDPGPGAYNDMKDALNWDTTRYLNIYTNDANGALGYATFPQQDAGAYQDGVVLLWSSVGRNNPNGGIYDQGRTGTHEVGHYLGLFHTFQGGCGTASAPYTTGDLIADTNRQSTPNYNCPAGASSCSSLDPIDNYMNYTQDTCMERFTAEQANRMRCALTSYRPTLYSGGGGGGGNELQNGVPVAGLAASTGGELRYTLEVPSGASNLAFQIAGGSGDADLYVRFGAAPTTSTWDCRPYLNGNAETCSFATPSAGTWHVMVRAYQTFSGVSLTGSYSTSSPNQPPNASFTSGTNDLTASFTDTSSDPDGTIASRSWAFGDGGTSSATNPSHTYASAGTYTVTLTVTDDDGATDSASQSVTVTAPPAGPTPLTNGVPVTGLGASQGQELHFLLDVPSGASDLLFQSSGGSGDADLYVRFGAQPTTSQWDCRPYVGGNAETCDFASPQPGTWYAMLRAYSTFSGVSLTGSFDESSGAPCTGCEQYGGTVSSGQNAYQPNGTYYYSGSGVHQGWLEGAAGTDFDLYLLRWNGSWQVVASSTSASSSESISYSGSAGYYTWRITAYSGSGSYDFWLDRP